eukprot:COSAG01_NODE_40444_length_463_cov_1.840659_1_plen_86_part_10
MCALSQLISAQRPRRPAARRLQPLTLPSSISRVKALPPPPDLHLYLAPPARETAIRPRALPFRESKRLQTAGGGAAGERRSDELGK